MTAARDSATGRLLALVLRYRLWVVGAVGTWNAMVDLWGGPRTSDFTVMEGGGERLFSSRWADAFEDPVIQNGPLTLAWSGANTIIDRVTGIPAQFLFAVAVYVGFSLGAIFLARTLARDRGQTLSPEVELGVGLVVVLSGIAWNAVQSGQPLDALVGVAWVFVARASLRDRPLQAGSLLVLAAALKIIALLGAPLLLLLPTFRRTLGAGLMTVAGIGAAYLPFFLFGEMNTLDYRWPIHDGTLPSLFTSSDETFTWPLRLVQAMVVVGLGAVVVRWARRHPEVVWVAPLALSLLRMVTDPIRVGYYWLGPQMIILLGLALHIRRFDARVRVVVIGLFLLMTLAPVLAPDNFAIFQLPAAFIVRWVVAVSLLTLGIVIHHPRLRPPPTAGQPAA